MEKRLKISISALFFAVVLVALSFIFWRIDKKGPSNIVKIEKSSFMVEVVTSPAAREQGLSGRKSLCQGCGMLFVFEKEGRYPFWMKGMEFDLDMIWIKNGRIVFIERNVNHAGGEKNVIDPGVLAEAVLELPAGESARSGIKIGSEVFFE